MSTMDFFEQQDRARSATRRLYFFYFLAVLFVIVALNVCLIGMFTFSHQTDKISNRNNGYLI